MSKHKRDEPYNPKEDVEDVASTPVLDCTKAKTRSMTSPKHPRKGGRKKGNSDRTVSISLLLQDCGVCSDLSYLGHFAFAAVDNVNANCCCIHNIERNQIEFESTAVATSGIECP